MIQRITKENCRLCAIDRFTAEQPKSVTRHYAKLKTAKKKPKTVFAKEVRFRF